MSAPFCDHYPNNLWLRIKNKRMEDVAKCHKCGKEYLGHFDIRVKEVKKTKTAIKQPEPAEMRPGFFGNGD